MSPKLFCFGLGYTGLAFARSCKVRGWRVAGTTRSETKRAALEAEGIEAHLFARDHPLGNPERALSGTTHLLSAIALDEVGDPVLDLHLEDIGERAALEWAGYLSTTGVYGDRQGEWVGESDPPAPSLPRTRRRVAAEGRWLASGLPAHVFRLAGIYGPGRSAFDALRAGTARRIVKPGQVFGRIHVDDIVSILQASIRRPNPGAIYNVADDEPAPPEDVVSFAAELLGIEPPPRIPFEKADLSPMARSFYADSRRVCNQRIHDEVKVELRYPTYREGLRAILADEH